MRTRSILDFVEKKIDRDEVVLVREIPASKAKYAGLDVPLDPLLATTLKTIGIEKLYTHQVEAISAAIKKRNVVIATSTSSGKSLCYIIPILQQSLTDPQATSLLMFPTKALAQDQLRNIDKIKKAAGAFTFQSGTYDGDTPADLRRTLRNIGSLILTNPDMLHQGILPNHFRWTRFLSNLKYVVIDEIHTYRGIFGSNVANVIRRLRRLCRSYGADPAFICCSATINNPKELADSLTGRETVLVNNDGSPSGPKQFALINPRKIDEEGLVRVSPIAAARRLMAGLVKDRIQTIAFSRTRRSAEIIFRYCQEELQKEGPSLANSVRAYRGGYLPQERREIERGLASGDLLGVSSTNALELGIDIGGLDASIIVSYPGTIASLWQQAGRAGRGNDPSLAALIAQNSPVDQFLMKNPEYVFEQNPENAIIDPDNPELAIWHLVCALYELPISEDEMNLFGEYTPAMLDMLIKEGQAQTYEDKWRLVKTTDDYPAAKVNLRSMNDVVYTIMEEGPPNRVIGTVDETTAYTQVHDNAIYLHDAETYIVKKLDTDRKTAIVKKQDLDYYTQAVSESNIRVEHEEVNKSWKGNLVCFGDATVTEVVVMFKKIKFHTSESLGYEDVMLPPQVLETTAFWIAPMPSAFEKARKRHLLPEEGLLGIANVLVNVMTLFTMCDVMDIGAVVDASNLGRYAIFVYDYYPGGIGFAARGYKLVNEIMEATLKVISECDCRDGCPSCVGAAANAYMHSLESATRDQIPDKHAALVMLHEMMGLPEYVPPQPEDSPPRPVSSGLPKFDPLPRRLEKKIHRKLNRLTGDE